MGGRQVVFGIHNEPIQVFMEEYLQRALDIQRQLANDDNIEVLLRITAQSNDIRRGFEEILRRRASPPFVYFAEWDGAVMEPRMAHRPTEITPQFPPIRNNPDEINQGQHIREASSEESDDADTEPAGTSGEVQISDFETL